MPKKTARRIIDERTQNVATTISGLTLTAAPSITSHSLLLNLDADDHLQYLRTDGTRTLTGNLGVASGVTIDGVDISAHVDTADIHVAHSGVTMTAGDGLTGGGTIAATRTFAVGAGAGITVNADDVALTTPGTLTVSSTNTATGSHTHAITSSANPGAAASLLASDASGYLSLVRLTLTDRLRTPLIDTASGNLALSPETGITTGLELHMATRVRTPVLDTAANYLTIQPSNSVTYFPAPGAIGMGTATPARKLHIEDATGAQMRLSYNLTNYMDFLVDSGGSWRIAPTGDIIVDPEGDDMRPLRNYAIRLGLDTSKYLSLHVAELIADTFVAEEVRSTIGGKIFVSPTTSLTRDLDAAALVYDTIAQRGSTTTALGEFTPAGYSEITQRGSTTTATGTGSSGYETIAQRGTATNAYAYGTSVNASAPTGLQEDDVLVAIVLAWQFTLTPPSGWTQSGDTLSWTADGTTVRLRVYYRVAGSSEPSSYTWQLSSIDTIVVTTLAYTNVNTNDPISDIDGQTFTSSTSMVAPSIDAATDADMLLLLGGIADDTNTEIRTLTPPSGMTELSDVAVNNEVWAKTYAAHQLLTASGATGTRTATISAEEPGAAFLVALRPAGGATGDTEVTVDLPTGTTDGDLLIARIAYTGGTLTTPSGWTEILSEAGTGVTLAIYQRTASSEPATYTWSLDDTNPMAIDTSAYYNVDTSDPIAAYDAQANASSTSMVAPTITPGTPEDMLLFAGAVAADVRATAPSGMTEDSDAGITGVGIYGADQLLASGDATGTRTATLASATANVGALISLRPIYTAASGATATIAPPTGTTTDDVMIATVAYTGGTLTPASGWTFVQAQAGAGVTLAIYRGIAGESEGNYVWSLNTSDALAVAISAYNNVDTDAPLDIYSAQANASGTSMIAPTVRITSPSSVLVFAGAIASDVRATAPSGMGEDADTGQTGVGIYMADQALSSAGATGTRTATLASAAANAAALVALRPSSTPDGSTPTTIYTKHNNLNNGDRVILEARLQVEFMAITSAYTEITAGEEYSYTVTRNLDGTGANSWIAGDAVVNLGQTGNGWIELYARYGMPRDGQGAYNRVGPTIVGNVRKSNTFNDFREHWAIGNLNGLYDFSSSIYGAAFGDPTQTWISLDDRATIDGGGLRFMNALIERGYIRNDGTWRFNGDADNYIAWDGSTMAVRGDIVVQQSNVQNAATFIETWESDDAIGRWTNYDGSGELSTVAVSDSVTGGRVLRVGNNSGNDQAWLISNQQLIPFDSSKLYRIKARIRRTAGTGTVYVGFAGVAGDGTTWVNINGDNSFGAQYYHAAANLAPAASWTEYTGYTQGTAATGDFEVGTAADPSKVHEDVRYLRPLILVNYNSVAGTTEVDMFSVETVAATWLGIDGTPIRFADAPSGTGLYLTPTHMGFYNSTISNWTTYFDSSGQFIIGTGAPSTNYLSWNGSTLTVSGTINVLGGNAALTDLSNSGISTLISGANIRVGDGAKDSTLDGWNIDSGEIVGQLDGVDQVVLNTSGQITAGGGVITLNATGIKLLSSQSAYANVNAYQIMSYDGSTVMGGLYGYEGSSSFGQFVRVYVENTNRPSNLILNAVTNSATYPANIGIISQSGASTARIDIEGVAGTAITGATSIEGTLTILGGTLLVPSDATIGGSWTTLTLTSPWGDNGSGWATAQYCRFGDWVMIKGLVTPSSNASADATILTLPSAIRPSENRRFAGIAASSAANLDVLSTGVVRVSVAVNTGQVASIECMYKL